MRAEAATERHHAGPHDPRMRLRRRQDRAGRRTVPRIDESRLERATVQAAEHLEQRRCRGGRRGDRPLDRIASARLQSAGERRNEPDLVLKPHSDIGAQLIVLGRHTGDFPATAHAGTKSELLETVLASFHRLQCEADWVIVEGAGSPAETNLRAHDIANMGFARAADVPVLLVGDIDRGHVIAALIGAHAVLDEDDRAQVRGFIINKFRGERALFDAGLALIEQRTGWPSCGVVPWLPSAMLLPEEDGLRTASPAQARAKRKARIRVVRHRHIANFDDFDPLAHEPHVQLDFIDPRVPLPLDSDLVILPGSKSTIADLALLREHGWQHDLRAYLRRGGRILGICAGLQMLGQVVRDPLRIEGSLPSLEGLGLLDIQTHMMPEKVLREVRGNETTTGARIDGYEIHVGRTIAADGVSPMVRFDDGTVDGAVDANGRVFGCHVHGLFESAAFRTALLQMLGTRSTQDDHRLRVDAALDEIAATLGSTVAIDRLCAIARRFARPC